MSCCFDLEGRFENRIFINPPTSSLTTPSNLPTVLLHPIDNPIARKMVRTTTESAAYAARLAIAMSILKALGLRTSKALKILGATASRLIKASMALGAKALRIIKALKARGAKVLRIIKTLVVLGAKYARNDKAPKGVAEVSLGEYFHLSLDEEGAILTSNFQLRMVVMRALITMRSSVAVARTVVRRPMRRPASMSSISVLSTLHLL